MYCIYICVNIYKYIYIYISVYTYIYIRVPAHLTPGILANNFSAAVRVFLHCLMTFIFRAKEQQLARFEDFNMKDKAIMGPWLSYVPLSSECGTRKTVKAIIWPWISRVQLSSECGTHKTVKAAPHAGDLGKQLLSRRTRLPPLLDNLRTPSPLTPLAAPLPPVAGLWVEGRGLRVEGEGLRVEGEGWRVNDGGWRVKGGGWRV